MERGQTTRERLVATATRLFAARGFEATSIEAVLEAAGVSRGSLYHHFPSKEALFEAAFVAVELRTGDEVVRAAARATTTMEALQAGCREWTRLARDPEVQRIALIDAPAVLGWERWRTIEEAHALGLLQEAMGELAKEGRIPAELADAFAHSLLATLNELALMIARADDQSSAQRIADAAIEEILARLLGG